MNFVSKSLLFVAALSAGLAFAQDAAKGQQAAAACGACHGPDGNSMIAANPSLAGMSPQYIVRQLQAFKSKVRDNAVMAGMAAPLSDADMKNIAEYYSQQKPRVIGAKDKALAESAQGLYRQGDAARGIPACAACHSPTGAGIAGQYPRLGGQHAEYTYEELKSFATGSRGAHKDDVNGKIMAAIATRLTDREMKALAEYASGLR